MDREDGMATRLTDRPVLQFDVEDGAICYTGRLDRKAYYIDKDGQNERPAEGFGT